MANCAICKEKISLTFLNKVIGTHIRDAKGKRHVVCSHCQQKLKTREAIVQAMK